MLPVEWSLLLTTVTGACVWDTGSSVSSVGKGPSRSQIKGAVQGSGSRFPP